jgi:L-2-hydroxycarboxylate dehydrogenase (NAD+)
VAVDNAFHYLWGGGYVMDAAQRGYIAYTNCTAALTEVVPFGGTHPTLGTNPHSWGFPTTDAVGFPIVIDWATSVIAMGRVQQIKREGNLIPQKEAAIDKDGNFTDDPNKVTALTTFGRHKGYGLSLINEIMAGYIGGSTPTLRSRWADDGDKHTCAFYFQVIHPEALSGNDFAAGRSQADNVKVVIDDILGHGNDNCLLPGQMEAAFAKRTEAAGGLLFSEAEIGEFNEIAEEAGLAKLDLASFKLADQV